MTKKWIAISLTAIVVFSLLGILTSTLVNSKSAPVLAENVQTQGGSTSSGFTKVDQIPAIISGGTSGLVSTSNIAGLSGNYSIFLKIDGIPGEIDWGDHKQGWIELGSFSFGVSRASVIGSATGGAGAGKIKFNEFSFNHKLDVASPRLMSALVQGSVSKNATLDLVYPNGQIFYELILTKVMVSSINLSGNSMGQPLYTITSPNQPSATVTVPMDRPSEQVSLNFGGVQWAYFPPNPAATAGNSVTPITGSFFQNDLDNGR